VRPSRVQSWVLATRPKTLPAAVVPVLVGTAVAHHEGANIHPWVFTATLVAALLIQVATNFANDYSDFLRGADNDGRLGPLRVTQSGLLSPGAVRGGILIAIVLALLLGGYLAWVGGWPIIAIGLLSILSGLAYTGGPWPFGYHALGDAFVFVFFGVVAVMGTCYLQTGDWSALAFAASIPVGLLSMSILIVNNLRDLPTDRAAGKHTLAVRIGDRATRWQYAVSMAAAYLTPVILVLRDLRTGWLLLPWLSVPLAAGLLRRVLGGTAGRELNPVLERSGQLLLVFGGLLAAGFALVQ
jgi:1,4-dihydroxy-2-naphthoate octaprenyltransferase